MGGPQDLVRVVARLDLAQALVRGKSSAPPAFRSVKLKYVRSASQRRSALRTPAAAAWTAGFASGAMTAPTEKNANRGSIVPRAPCSGRRLGERAAEVAHLH